ncbi:hypothetical protein AHF37_03336 [Paragonimus kellicotti]|nr:hypothetical protein AHF37_03336 [Paragonimus kellicotti]
MALTSVVQSYLPQQSGNELQSSTNFVVSPYANCQSHHIPQMNSVTVLESPETTANMLLASTSLPNGAFFSSPTAVQNGFITANANLNGSDAYHYVQPSIQPRLLNEFGQAVRNPAIVGTPPFLSTGTHACLLPTPLPVSQDSLNQSSGLFLPTARPGVEVGSDASTCMTDEITSAKSISTHTEQSTCNPQSLVLIVRLLMSGKEVGSIIGKRGENVKKYREESGAKINISDGSSPERIVTITGTTKQIFVAFSLMSQKFEDLVWEPFECPVWCIAEDCSFLILCENSILYFHPSQLTGASIQVASEALPTSTERTVTISGTAKAIAKCIRHLCEIFIESPVKGPVVPYRPKPAFVNQSATCANVSFSSTMVNSCLTSQNGTGNNNGLFNSGSEISNENGFPSNMSTTGLVMTSTTQAAVSKELAAAASQIGQFIGAFGYQPKYATMDNGSAISPSAFNTTPDEPTSTNTGLVAVRHPAMVTDMLTDPLQLSTSLNHTNFMANSTPFLGVLNSAYLGTAPVSNAIINPLSSAFALPEFGLNPGLFSFYTPQAPNGLTTGANIAYSGVGNLLKSSLNGTDENGIDSLSEGRAPVAGLTDIYPILSLVQPNTYGLQPGNLSQSITTGPLPFVQNKASLLGLPAVPYPTVIGSNPGQLLPSSELHFTAPDEPVIKEIIISNDLIGCIIGRGGTTVNEIRNISKAQIKISSCEDGAKERKISLSGPLAAVNLAHFLINNR